MNQLTTKDFFSRDDVKAKFSELLGKRAPQFITSVLQSVASNKQLAKADPATIYQAAAVAATMDLPINNNLGFAYIVPYGGQDGVKAQFQMGYKGFIQLAQRSGQFKNIGACRVCEGQLIEDNPLTGPIFDWKAKTSDKIIGYAAFFSLINGFEKVIYMTSEEMTRHAGRFSQTFKKGFGIWKDDFDSMAIKTVIKLLLSKYAPLSIEMQTAVITDQAIVKDASSNDVDYADAEVVTAEDNAQAKENQRIADFIANATTIEQLDEIYEQVPEELTEMYLERKGAIANPQTDAA